MSNSHPMSNSQNLSKKSHGIDNDYYNYKYTSQDNRVTTQQKGDFQNDINQRLNMVNDDSIQNRRKLPFNNNIRDSQITIDNKRLEGNSYFYVSDPWHTKSNGLIKNVIWLNH